MEDLADEFLAYLQSYYGEGPKQSKPGGVTLQSMTPNLTSRPVDEQPDLMQALQQSLMPQGPGGGMLN